MIRIALSEQAAGEREAKTLSVPWTAPSPYRKREIIQGANGDVVDLNRSLRGVGECPQLKHSGPSLDRT